MSFPWYTIINKDDSSIEQGDFIDDCPIYIPNTTKIETGENKVDIIVKEYNVIVISQSCDLVQGKIDIIQVCPYIALDDIDHIKKATNTKDKAKRCDTIRQGIVPHLHLLKKHPENANPLEFIVVDFRYIFGVEYKFISEYIKGKGDRLRINPPYREHLSQAFARYFMRVGLPSDIPQFG